MLDLKLIQLEGGDDDWDKSSFEAITNNLNDYNRYKTENLIATGGMKEIYKVFDNKNHRHVAMAKLRTDIPEEHCEDFIQEAQLTASLRHPNIITFYDSGVDAEGVPFFTLELKVGDNLAQILKKRSQENNYKQLYSTDRLLNIFIKICDAISYAHSVNVIHLDLKPDNIQVGEFGEVQVCDWGLAINLNENVQDEEIGRIKGTPGFMAPEQILNGKLDCQTDIYALGALLYCILCGDSAYQGGLETILKKTVESDIASLNEQMLGSDIPESLKSVIKTAMANEKNARYTNVEEMKKDIESYLSGHSTSVENASFYKELKLFYKRNMLICSVVIAALLIAAVASNYFLLRIKESNDNLKISNDKVSAALAESEKNYALFKAKVLEEKRLTENILNLNVNQELENFQYPLFFTELYKKQAVSFDNTISSSIKYLLRYKDMIKTEEYRDKLVFALFISQNFDDVFSFEKDIDPDLFNVAKKYSLLKSTDQPLNDEHFLQFLKDINTLENTAHSKKILERAIVYQLKMTDSAYANADVIRQLIKAWNPGWNENLFEYHSQSFRVKISGSKLETIRGVGRNSSRITFLKYLKVNHLNIRGSSLSDFQGLDGLQAQSIDIRDSKINSLRQIRKLKELKKIIINKDKFNEEELLRVFPWVEVEQK